MFSPTTADQWTSSRKKSLAEVENTVSTIIAEVRARGDKALHEYTRRFDHTDPADLAIPKDTWKEAYNLVDGRIVDALKRAHARILAFHELQKQKDLWLTEVEPGIILGMKTTPLSRIGAYIPGGRASYPSTVLMCTVPARVAGVSRVCCCTPPPVSPLTLVAMDIAGVDEAYCVGGAQAVAAMALGTESIMAVEKIVGPGNAYVTAAKMLLRGTVETDFPAGPSEIAIIADSTADPEFIAADILAQCEHDPDAGAVLITSDPCLPKKVADFMAAGIEISARKEIISRSLPRTGYILVEDLMEAVTVSDQVAPEHLSMQVKDPLSILSSVRNAGSIFIGPYTPVSCGDYASGTNHVLPTAGHARTFSGLSVTHFVKTSTVQMISREGLEAICDITEDLASSEGLDCHARSVRIRREKRINPV
jgi:histidinol dehydrogenase